MRCLDGQKKLVVLRLLAVKTAGIFFETAQLPIEGGGMDRDIHRHSPTNSLIYNYTEYSEKSQTENNGLSSSDSVTLLGYPRRIR